MPWQVPPLAEQAIVPGGNGVFQATIVRGGRVIGTWKRSAARGRTAVRVIPLVTVRATDRKRIERAFDSYARFLDAPLQVTWA